MHVGASVTETVAVFLVGDRHIPEFVAQAFQALQKLAVIICRGDQKELIAAQTIQKFTVMKDTLQYLAGLDQVDITLVVAVGIVAVFEVVQIDKCDGERCRNGQQFFQFVIGSQTVADPGQGICRGTDLFAAFCLHRGHGIAVKLIGPHDGQDHV